MNQVRLIVVAGVHGGASPVHITHGGQRANGPLKALNAVEELRSQSHLFTEDAAEPAFA